MPDSSESKVIRVLAANPEMPGSQVGAVKRAALNLRGLRLAMLSAKEGREMASSA